MRFFKRLGQRGDTIVEVMIVLAVLGSAFSIAMATANQGLAKSRNAEEHSQALGLLSSQLELMRSASDAGTDVYGTANSFCMNGSTVVPFNGKVQASANDDPMVRGAQANQYPDACNPGDNNALYFESITYDASTASFTLRVRWPGVAKLGSQEERFNYRIRQLASDNGTGVNTSLSTGQVTVQVFPLQPSSYAANPACTDPLSGVKSGASVNLHGTNVSYDATQNTGLSSVTIFSNLVDSGTYHATVNSAPAGYDLCGTTTKDLTLAVGNNAQTFSDATLVPHGWWALGHGYALCVPGEANLGAGQDGCDPAGIIPLSVPGNGAMFSRRDVNITYNLNTTAMNTPAKACLRIAYQQYQGANTQPPPAGVNGWNGGYDITAKIHGATTTTQSMNLPIESNSAASWNPHYSGCQVVTIPSGATTLELDWTNNTSNVNTKAGDPDLQINSVQLYYAGD